jgi:hypothetical protein
MWTWEKVQNEAFNPLKKSLTAAPVLALFDPGKVILLYTDASRWGLAGILVQKHGGLETNKNITLLN